MDWFALFSLLVGLLCAASGAAHIVGHYRRPDDDAFDLVFGCALMFFSMTPLVAALVSVLA